MTPAEFRETLERQGLSQAELARLVYSTPPMVCQYASGYHKVPGGVRAFLELREGKDPPIHLPKERIRQGQVLLRYCKVKGLTYREGVSHISEHIIHMKTATWVNSRNRRMRDRIAKWDA